MKISKGTFQILTKRIKFCNQNCYDWNIKAVQSFRFMRFFFFGKDFFSYRNNRNFSEYQIISKILGRCSTAHSLSIGLWRIHTCNWKFSIAWVYSALSQHSSFKQSNVSCQIWSIFYAYKIVCVRCCNLQEGNMLPVYTKEMKTLLWLQ